MTKIAAVMGAVLLAPLFGWMLAPALMFLPVLLALMVPIAAMLVFLGRRRPAALVTANQMATVTPLPMGDGRAAANADREDDLSRAA
jgi:hypothetical protein